MSFTPPFNDPLFLQRGLSGFAAAMASLVATFTGPAGIAAQGPAALQASLSEGYLRLFSLGVQGGSAATVPSGPVAPTPAFARFQAAAARWSSLMSAIAQDAAFRLATALQDTGPGAPPITSLAELRALWVDCGEAAYADAVRRDEFAAAQAELLMATVELSTSP